MAKLIYGMHQSLDGYVDHMKLGPPGPAVFQHFIEQVRDMPGVIYGRRLYEIMRYWEEDQAGWDAEGREFAVAWRSKPKWVVSRSLKTVGPNATLIAGDVETELRKLKAEQPGEIRIGGPDLARSLTAAGLIDEYQIYLRPVVLGSGTPFFAAPPPPLRLAASDLIGEDVVRLTYVLPDRRLVGTGSLNQARYILQPILLRHNLFEGKTMPRPYWSGQIQISLVSFTVKLFVATESKGELHFHQISRKTGERVRHQKVLASAIEAAPDQASTPVEKNDIVKGFEYSKGQYVTIEPEEMEHLRVPSKHTVEITQFVALNELAPEYLEKPYFVVPENDLQAEAFAVVRRALEKTNKAALGKIAFGGREHVLAITAAPGDDSRGMMAYTMRYQEELRSPAEYFRDINRVEINEDSLDLAETLIRKKAAKFDPSKFVDGYEVALKELVDAKVNHAPIPKDEPAAPKRGNVVNLMDALRKSLGDKESTPEDSKKKSPKSAPAAKKGIALVRDSPPTHKSAAKRKSA